MKSQNTIMKTGKVKQATFRLIDRENGFQDTNFYTVVKGAEVIFKTDSYISASCFFDDLFAVTHV